MLQTISRYFLQGIFCCLVSLSAFTEAQAQLSAIEDSTRVKILNKVEGKSVMEIMQYANLFYRSKLHIALAFTETALDLARKTNNLSDIYTIYRDMGYFNEINNQLLPALNAYTNALEAAEEMEDTEKLLMIYTDIAITHRKLGNYTETKKFHLKSLDLGESIDDHATVEYGYHGLGFLYETIGDLEKAIEYYFKSMEVAEKRGSAEGMITTLQNIGISYSKLNNHELAFNSIERAFKLANQRVVSQNDTLQLANVLNDYGEILQAAGTFSEALKKHQASLNIYKSTHSKSNIARSLIHIADIYTETGAIEFAHGQFLQALTYDEYISSEDKANLHNKLGHLYLKKKQMEEAANSFHKSLEIADEHDFKPLLQNGHFNLYKIYLQKDSSEKALVHLTTSMDIKNSLINENKSKRIAEMQFKFDAEKSEKEIHLLRLRQNELVLFGFSFIFILIAAFFTYIIRVKGKSNKRLSNKNEEIQFQNIKLRESNEVLKQFAYVAAHDLKEPLRNIGSFTNLIQNRYGKQFNEEANEYMDFVKTGVKRLNGLLTDLLEYSRISAQEPEQEMVEVEDVLRTVNANLRERISETGAQMEYEILQPNICISRLHLTQLLQNLIGNGMKFSKDQPRIKVDCYEEDDHTVLAVSDNGIGIDESYQNKIFNLFHRLDKTKNVEGTGIGLTICKNIVDKYDGEIWFESEPGNGTTFFVRFPLSNGTEEEFLTEPDSKSRILQPA